MNKTLPFVVAALAAALVAPGALADEAAAGGTDSLRVVRDKETGQLRAPNNEELKKMVDDEKAQRKALGQAEPSANPQPVEVRSYASGMKAAVLGPEFLVTLEARRDADGSLVVKHNKSEYDGHAEQAHDLPTE